MVAESLNTDNQLPINFSRLPRLKFTNSHTTWRNSTSKVPSKPKSETKLSHQLSGTVPLTIYHQNVRRLRGKASELLSQLYPTFPHILCCSEHHMNHLVLQQTFFDNYKLAASYCRTLYEKGVYAYLCKKV
jgi:hypothetical protein